MIKWKHKIRWWGIRSNISIKVKDLISSNMLLKIKVKNKA